MYIKTSFIPKTDSKKETFTRPEPPPICLDDDVLEVTFKEAKLHNDADMLIQKLDLLAEIEFVDLSLQKGPLIYRSKVNQSDEGMKPVWNDKYRIPVTAAIPFE